MVSNSKRGLNYEKRICRERNVIHIGGAGKPDYKCKDSGYGEIKCYNHPITKGELRKELNKRNKTPYKLSEIISKKGYTPEAINYCRHYHPEVRLLKGSSKIVKTARR